MNQAAQSVDSVWRQMIPELCRRPIRLTLQDPDSKERVGRAIGLIMAADMSGLRVEVVDWTGDWAERGPATVEVLMDDQVLWFSTDLQERHDTCWTLTIPTGFQQAQRRRYPRVDLEVPVHVVDTVGLSHAATLRDISAGGASVRTPSALTAGQTVTLVFDLGLGLYFRPLQAEVVRTSPWAGRGYVSGLRFLTSDAQRNAIAEAVERLNR